MKLDSSVTKHLFSILETKASEADRIENIRVSPTNERLLTTIHYTINNSTEIQSDAGETQKYERITGLHLTYYCVPRAYGVEYLGMIIEFKKCPDIVITWRKQCG